MVEAYIVSSHHKLGYFDSEFDANTYTVQSLLCLFSCSLPDHHHLTIYRFITRSTIPVRTIPANYQNHPRQTSESS